MSGYLLGSTEHCNCKHLVVDNSSTELRKGRCGDGSGQSIIRKAVSSWTAPVLVRRKVFIGTGDHMDTQNAVRNDCHNTVV